MPGISRVDYVSHILHAAACDGSRCHDRLRAVCLRLQLQCHVEVSGLVQFDLASPLRNIPASEYLNVPQARYETSNELDHCGCVVQG